MGLGRFFKKVGKIAAAPVTVPAKVIKSGVEKGMQQAILGVVRHVLTTIGGGMVANGTLSGSDLESAIGAIVTLVGIAWSVITKLKAPKPA